MNKIFFVLLIVFSCSMMLVAPDNSSNELLLKSGIGSSDFAIAFIGFGIALLVRGDKK